MSTYLGRLVDRAAGPPASAVSPRLAPVFPLGRVPQPEPEPLHAESSPEPPVAHGARRPAAPTREVMPPPADTPDRSVTASLVTAVSELREIHIERPAREPREPVAPAPIEAPAAERSRTEIRTHERTLEHSSVRREAELAQPAKAPALAAPRVERQPVPVATRDRASVPEPARIVVRIGRVEVRRPHTPDPVEWPAQAAAPPAATGFGELAASRRYVDRSWSWS